MMFSKATLFAFLVNLVSFFAFFISSVPIEAKTALKKPNPNVTTSQKKWAVIDGFRSAKFGMDEKKVTRAIAKDFKISRSKIDRQTHPIEKTLTLNVTVPDLLATGGAARISYILGHKSKKLMQVNVSWGVGASKNFKGQSIVDTANIMRDHLNKKKYQDDAFVLNGQINPTQLLVFRGSDKKGRMNTLILTTPKIKEGENTKVIEEKISLILSYIADPGNPDVLSIGEGMF
jgi:hypothetical protein